MYADGKEVIEEFMEYWVRSDAVPHLQVAYRYFRSEGDLSQKKIQLGIHQQRWAGELVKWWKGLVWIRIVEEGTRTTGLGTWDRRESLHGWRHGSDPLYGRCSYLFVCVCRVQRTDEILNACGEHIAVLQCCCSADAAALDFI